MSGDNARGVTTIDPRFSHGHLPTTDQLRKRDNLIRNNSSGPFVALPRTRLRKCDDSIQINLTALFEAWWDILVKIPIQFNVNLIRFNSPPSVEWIHSENQLLKLWGFCLLKYFLTSIKIAEIRVEGKARIPTCLWQNAALDSKRGYLKPERRVCQCEYSTVYWESDMHHPSHTVHSSAVQFILSFLYTVQFSTVQYMYSTANSL